MASREIEDDTPDVDRAYWYFVVSWLGMNGAAGTASCNWGFCKRYTNNGGHAAKRFASAVSSIPAWRRRMRKLTVLRDDAFGLLERIEDAKGTAIYVDSPYWSKGASYLHDFEREDHQRLADAVGRFKKARVVVSYYDCEEVRALYDGWTWVDCSRTKAMVSAGKRDKGNDTRAPEVLIVNGPSYTSEAGSLFGGGA